MPPLPARRALLGTLLLIALQPLASPAQTPAAAPGPSTAAGGTGAASPARLLYTLTTRCSLAGGAAQPCTVEAIDEGIDTLYRHRVGARTLTIRITEKPVTMAQLDGSGRRWQPLQSAAALFSTNTICFNGRELCVVNPNYLNSIREDRPDLNLQGRDLVRVHFGPDGRIDASCYDAGCKVVFQ